MAKNVIVISGSISKWNVSRDYVDYYLRQAGSGPVTVQIHSLGGDVDEAIAISNLFADHGNVTVEYVGFNASAATFMAFGAKEILIHEDTFWLIHKCSVGVDIYGSLSSDEIDVKIEELKKAKKTADAINLVIAKKYLDRCGTKKKKNMAEVLTLMGEERWMASDEIIDWNFADSVLPGINKPGTVSNQVSNDLQAHGFKLPENVIVTAQTEKSLLDKMEDLFSRLVKAPSPKIYLPINNIHMNTEFVALLTLLAVEGLAENEGKITLTTEQLKTVNDAIVKLQADLSAANTATQTARDAAAADMSLLNAVSPKIAEAVDMAAKCTAIKTILDSIPAPDQVKPVRNEGGVDFSDIAVDPVNRYGEED